MALLAHPSWRWLVSQKKLFQRKVGHGKLHLVGGLFPPICKKICARQKLDHETIWRTKKENYFTSSDPHHDMSGGGCQVRVVIKNMMGRMENLRTLISGFLGLVILVRWALVTMFLSWTTQTGCRIHRTYVSLIGSGEGRHTTHLLKCVLLLSTSQTDWKQSSDILSDNVSDIFLTYLLTFFLTNLLTLFLTYLLTFFLTSFWHIFWHIFLTYQNQNLTSTASQKSRSANSIFTSHHAAKVISTTTLCL